MGKGIHSDEPSSLRFTHKTTSADVSDTNYAYEITGTPLLLIQLTWARLCSSSFFLLKIHYDNFSIKIHSHPVDKFIVSSKKIIAGENIE